MEWDASRISAAIPSGVGFLGAGLIFKNLSSGTHVVVGITTATSLWVSAAVGVACGGKLYFVAMFSVSILLVLLRFGPRALHADEKDEVDDAYCGAASRETALDDGPNAGETTPLTPLKSSMTTVNGKDILQ
eukprot:CAMPEP_0172418070 /NCGR_PEP_ID=MMETSP1064-20121228/4590_1 /TAXON_ID=202472 /ORGANISM="Aulacoseira subarctica , Strain CCAP 1002/5" /LENGTH=131 /DNA_ID=CAMNT_0013156791 /DNA_START=329 /DNA_END=725 /DNA_ORIENTATION=-